MSPPASQDALRLPQCASRVSRLVQHQATASRARYEITARSDAKLLTRKQRRKNGRHPRPYLPLQDRRGWVYEHDDVKEQVIADGVADKKLKRDYGKDRGPDRDAPGEEEAESHKENIGDGVDDAVAEVVERDGRLAVAVDDEVGVLEDLPRNLHTEREE